MTSIFPELQKLPDEKLPENISAFEYLCRSDRVEAELVKRNLCDWFSRYPKGSQDQLFVSLSSSDNSAHQSAFFELAVHEILVRTDNTILEIEPKLGDKGKQPDFLCISRTDERFVVECTNSQGKSRTEMARQKHLDEAIVAINELKSNTHAVWLHYDELPKASIKKSKLKNPIGEWLKELDPKDGPDDKNLELTIDNVQFRLSPIPVKKPQKRIVGIYGLDAASMSTQPDALRRNLKKKCNKYGDIGLPFYVAVNAPTFARPNEDLVDVLFGNPAVRFDPNDPQNTAEEFRRFDGFWINKSGAINQRLTGILATNSLNPWSVAQRRIWCFENPWPRYGLASPFKGIETISVVDNLIQDSTGTQSSEFFGLEPGWPEN